MCLKSFALILLQFIGEKRFLTLKKFCVLEIAGGCEDWSARSMHLIDFIYSNDAGEGISLVHAARAF